jgi:predicted RNase H-like HicB family nuclease
MEEGNLMNTVVTAMPKKFSCLLSPDMETGRWNGHCLDFDIATSGKDEESAWQNLKLIVRYHIEDCFEKWPEGLSRTASQDRWKRFEFLRAKGGMFRQDKIHLNLVTPTEDDLWISMCRHSALSKRRLESRPQKTNVKRPLPGEAA